MTLMARWVAAVVTIWIVATGGGRLAMAQIPESASVLPTSSEELGQWPVEIFSPADYDGHPQTWDTAQDDRGILYVATTDGVLVFDGETWKEVIVGNGSPVLDLAICSDGRVCVGGLGELGCLSADSMGRYRYRSLVDALPDSVSGDLGDVYRVHASGETVYYQTPDLVIRHDADGTLDVWDPDGFLFLSSMVRDTLYVHEVGRGLLQLAGGQLERVPGTERLQEYSNHFVIPHPDGGLLFSTYAEGLFHIDERGVRPFRTDVDPLLSRAKPYHAAVLPNGWIAIGTLLEGLIILSSEGKLIRTLNAENVLHTNGVNRVTVGREAGLWLNTTDGLAHVDLASPLTFFGSDEGLKSPAQSFARSAGTLYASTDQGVYALQPSGSGTETWTQVIGAQPCSSTLVTDAGLLVACSAGIYRIRGGQVANIYPTDMTQGVEEASHIFQDPVSDDRLWVGTRNDLVALQRSGDTWVEEYRVDDLAERIDSYAWQSDDELWAATFFSGVVRIRLDRNRRVVDVQPFTETDGIPPSRVMVARIDGRVMFGTPEGIYSLRDRASDGDAGPDGGKKRPAQDLGSLSHFAPDSTLGPTLLSSHVHALRQGPDGAVWAVTGDQVGLVRRPRSSETRGREDSRWGDSRWEDTRLGDPRRAGESWLWYPSPPASLRGESVGTLYAEPDGTAWMGSPDGAIRFRPPRVRRVEERAKALIRHVSILSPTTPMRDSVLYAGGYGADFKRSVLDHPHDDLRFRYALAAHRGAGEVRYRYRLDGYEEGWSPWTTKTTKDYTNLNGGTYTFRVQARGPDGRRSDVGTYAVQILPPWYETGWAFLLFGMLGATLLGTSGWALYRYRTHRLRQRNRLLQARVRAKTKGLRHEQERLERANRELKRTNQTRSELLGVAAHDLKNPLYGIMETSKILLDKLGETEFETSARKFLPLIRSAAEQMHELVHGLLDAHIVEAGEVDLQPTQCDVRALTESVLRWNQPHANEKRITFQMVAPEACWAEVDETHVQRVIDNLVSNAIKFSPSGSSVRVTLEGDDAWVEVRVEDEGPGLTAQDQERLFEKLARLSATPTGGESSTGIGLHIAKQLVDEHNGELYAESAPGEGATFILRLPRTQPSEEFSTQNPSAREPSPRTDSASSPSNATDTNTRSSPPTGAVRHG